jgi:hypothetical protein
MDMDMGMDKELVCDESLIAALASSQALLECRAMKVLVVS